MIDFLGDDKRFDVSDILHTRIERHKPTFEGSGGYQIVYGGAKFPDKVVKVDARDLLLSADADYTSYNDAKDQDDILDRENKRFQALKKHFGAEHVLDQNVQLLKVPVNKRYLGEIKAKYAGNLELPDLDAFTGSHVWTIVTIQERTDLLKNTKRVSLTGGYSEKRPLLSPFFREVYSEVTDQTVINPEQAHKVKPDTLAKVHEHLLGLTQAMEKDRELREAVADFVEKAIAYTTETGEILDIGGKDNVIFFKNAKDRWSYKLVDAIFPANGHKIIEEGRTALESFSSKGEAAVDSIAKGILYNCVNYVRLINGLAGLLGVEKRVNIAPNDFRHDPVVLLDYLRH